MAGDMNVGLLVNVLFAILVGSFSLAQLTPKIQSFISATSAAQKVFQTIRRIPSIDSLDEGGQKPDLKGDIRFTNVSFIYPARPQGTPSLSVVKVNQSHCSQECLVFYPGGKVYCYRWIIWVGKINYHPLTRTFLRPRRRICHYQWTRFKDSQRSSSPFQHQSRQSRTHALCITYI